MKHIYWLRTDRILVWPADKTLPAEAWESVEVSDAEYQKFVDAETRIRRELEYAFHHPHPMRLPDGPYKFGFTGFTPERGQR